jgi:hypothetical protein
MSKLFIGPYRDNTTNGEISRQYILTLCKNHNINIKPYHLDNSPYEQLDDVLKKLEETNPDNEGYDCCIQHLPLDRLAYSGFFKQHIAIPIFSGHSNITDTRIVETLNRFDKIIVNTPQEISMLLKADVESQILQADIDVSDAVDKVGQKRYNFGAHNGNHKFYGFFHYKREQDIIKKLLLSFYIAFRCRDGQSIILSIVGDTSDQKNLSQFIQQTKQELNIRTSNKSLVELFLFTPMNTLEQVALHQTCETLLCFSHGSTIMHKTIAKHIGNHIIDEENTVMVDVPCYSGTEAGYLPDDNHSSILTNSLINNMREFVFKQPTEEQTQSKNINLLSRYI